MDHLHHNLIAERKNVVAAFLSIAIRGTFNYYLSKDDGKKCILVWMREEKKSTTWWTRRQVMARKKCINNAMRKEICSLRLPETYKYVSVSSSSRFSFAIKCIFSLSPRRCC